MAGSFRKGLVSSSDFFIEAQYHIAGNEARILTMGGEFLSAEMMQRIAHQVEQFWREVGATRDKKAKRKAMARFPQIKPQDFPPGRRRLEAIWERYFVCT
jgi:hypothetical protein